MHAAPWLPQEERYGAVGGPVQVALLMIILCNVSLGALAESDRQQLLDKFRALPDLLDLAIDKAGPSGDRYHWILRLEAEFLAKRRPYKTTMPYRHRVTCYAKQHTFGAALHTLVNPRKKRFLFFGTAKIKVWNREIHELEEHGARFSSKLSEFLRDLP